MTLLLHLYCTPIIIGRKLTVHHLFLSGAPNKNSHLSVSNFCQKSNILAKNPMYYKYKVYNFAVYEKFLTIRFFVGGSG